MYLLYAFGWFFFKDDMSSWVLPGIHIQRPQHTIQVEKNYSRSLQPCAGNRGVVNNYILTNIKPIITEISRCCVTVDSAMPASQNSFSCSVLSCGCQIILQHFFIQNRIKHIIFLLHMHCGKTSGFFEMQQTNVTCY